jgi:uncharacterized phage protein gp47/JayE
MTTIVELKEQISKDLRNRLNLSDDKLKKVLDALSGVLAAQFKLAYLGVEDAQRNLYPDTADTFENGGSLNRLGSIYLNRDIRPATSAIYRVNVTGVEDSVLRSGLTFKSNEDSENAGKLYILENEYTLTGTNDIITIRSIGGGLDYLQDNGNNLTITEPVIGVDKTVVINKPSGGAIFTDPLAAETTQEFRNSILNAIQLEPQGGSKSDYRIWASDAAGVRFVYPYVKDGEAGTVQIFVESSGNGGVPSQAVLDEVEEVINFDPDETKPTAQRARRPIQVNLEVVPIDPIDVEINITGLEDSSTTVRDAIELNLIEFLKNIRPFVDGSDLLRNKNDILYSAKLQGVVSDVLDPDNFFNNFSMLIDGVSQTSFIFSREKIPNLINVNYL